MKKKLRKMFRDLRKHNITARMNFMCCQSCGVNCISEHKKKNDYGYVFYHNQDNEGLKETNTTYVSWGVFEEDDKNKLKELSRTIIKVAEQNYIKVNWNGESSRRIELDISKVCLESLYTEAHKRRILSKLSK